MTLLSSLLSATNFKSPFLRTLAPSIGLAYGIQTAVAIPSILAKSERFYDLSGALTNLTCVALSLYLPAIRARAAAAALGAVKPAFPSLLAALSGNSGALGFNWRQIALSAAASIWAIRLGSYLFARIMSEGEDSRFENIRGAPLKFFAVWMAQATWVSVCLLPVLAVNSLPTSAFAALGTTTRVADIIGLTLYVGGLGYEVVADYQKNSWAAEKKQKKHDQDFITRGLWSKSRHPNYFGESTLWTGIATTAAGVLATNASTTAMGQGTGLGAKAIAVGLAGVSPAFATFLLLKVSGVSLSEAKYDKKYGHREDYQKWKRETPMYIPKL